MIQRGIEWRVYRNRLLHAAMLGTCFLTTLLFVEAVSADTPDVWQNQGSNNYAFDVPAKFYVGGSFGQSFWLNRKLLSQSSQMVKLPSTSLLMGLFTGYRLNHHVAIETEFSRLGQWRIKNQALAFKERASIYQASIDAILSEPIWRTPNTRTSLSFKAGYGVGLTHERMTFGDQSTSGNSLHGIYRLGLGVQVDWRSNVSVRLFDTYSPVYYNSPGGRSLHHVNQVTLGLYYNFT